MWLEQIVYYTVVGFGYLWKGIVFALKYIGGALLSYALIYYVPLYLNEYRISFGLVGNPVIWYVGYLIIVIAVYLAICYYWDNIQLEKYERQVERNKKK